MYTTPADAPLSMTWMKALKYAAGLEAHGHKDWCLPSKAELNVLFNNRAAIGGFEDGWYWSFTEGTSYSALVQRFSDGTQGHNGYSDETYALLLRCVRPGDIPSEAWRRRMYRFD